MNIFVLDADPAVAATMLCDQHVGKMLLEACQLLCNCHDAAPYKRTHYNHPCSVWARASRANYHWLLMHGFALFGEIKHRWPDRSHASLSTLLWCSELPVCACHFRKLCSLDKQGWHEDAALTPFAQATPEQYRGDDAVQAYRRYYAAEKRVLRGKPVTWTRRPMPEWFIA